MVRLSGVCLCQIDPLSCPKDNALRGIYICRHSPQPESHVEGIDAQGGPEGKLAYPMLFGMARGAQRNDVTIPRLHPNTTIGLFPNVRGFGWRCFAAANAGKLTDES